MKQIVISISGITIRAQIFDTACGTAIIDKLPIEAVPEEWGDEFYFQIPVVFPLDETSTTAVKVGDIGYWPPGRALAIFFGPTPMSKGNDPMPASEVNIVGRIIDDAKVLRNAKGAKRILIEAVE